VGEGEKERRGLVEKESCIEGDSEDERKRQQAGL
jgi:hypothetical protein